MSAEQQADVKRRSSRSAQERNRRRRRSRTGAAPTISEAQTAAQTAIAEPAEPEVSRNRAETRRLAKAESGKSRGRRGVMSNERAEGLRRFVRETSAEIKKVVWPDRETTRNLTIVVIALSIILGIVLGGIDFVLFELFEAF